MNGPHKAQEQLSSFAVQIVWQGSGSAARQELDTGLGALMHSPFGVHPCHAQRPLSGSMINAGAVWLAGSGDASTCVFLWAQTGVSSAWR